MNLIFWVTFYLLKIFFRIFYRVQVYGTEHIYKGGAILAPNHASFLDPPLISIAWPEHTYYLARSTLFRPRLFGWYLKVLHAYPVYGSAQDLSSFKMIQQLLEEQKKVVIFPEGIRSKDGTLVPIKTGVAMLALRAECPIIPVYIHGTFEAWPRDKKWPRLGGTLACVFGEPIFSETYTHMDKKQAREAMTEQVQQSILDLQNWYLSQKI